MKMYTGHESVNWSYIWGRKSLNALLERSEYLPQVIYKHSGRCSISYLSKQDLEENMDTLTNLVDIYLTEVIEQRALSICSWSTWCSPWITPDYFNWERAGRVVRSDSHREIM